MYGVYCDIIAACERTLAEYDRLRELLEYPEVQADKAQYLYILKQFNDLDVLKRRYDEFVSSCAEEQSAYGLLADGSTLEREYIFDEISRQKEVQHAAIRAISAQLGLGSAAESVRCRVFSGTPSAAKFARELFSLMCADITSVGGTVSDIVRNGGNDAFDGSFIASGSCVYSRSRVLCGAHRVVGSHGEYVTVGAVRIADVPVIADSDLKITLFHSSGAGGQNVNKVETAVRVTHVPTGLTVVCQDERSQLRNKERAVETIKKRLSDTYASAEKSRIDRELRSQFNDKHTAITFDTAKHTFTDSRLTAYTCMPFPPRADGFTAYVDALIATRD